ncbi:MAG: DUF6580 family putative transport protein [Candidatus Paceibacterota bacterium]|jgi:hypothetical protein
MKTEIKLGISVLLIGLGVLARVLPHLPNFAPVAAIAVFAGFYLGRRYALVLPIIAMLIGDLFIGFYDFKMMAAVYGSFVLVGYLASVFKSRKNTEVILGTSLVGSVTFFLVTNWAVWQFSGMYLKNWAGFLETYVMALPFFRNTFLGDVVYLAFIAGGYELAVYLAGKFYRLKEIKKIAVPV